MNNSLCRFFSMDSSVKSILDNFCLIYIVTDLISSSYLTLVESEIVDLRNCEDKETKSRRFKRKYFADNDNVFTEKEFSLCS